MAVQGASLPQDRSAAGSGSEDRLGKLFSGLFPGARGDALECVDLQRQLAQCAGRADIDTVLQSGQLSSRQRGQLTVGLQVLEEFLEQPAFHPQLAERLLDCAGPVLARATDAEGWLTGRGHALFPLLELIAGLALGWHPEHMQAEELAGQMQGWFRRLGTGESPRDVLEAARQWAERFRARTAKLEQRLRDREKGALQLQYASREAARVINRQLAGRELPQSVARDLSEVWRPGLQWILLNESGQGQLWNRAVRLLTLLIWSVQPARDSERAAEKRRRVAADVKAQLPEMLERILPEPGLKDRMLEELQIIWLSLDHDRPVDFVNVPPLDTGSLLDEAGASVSRDLLGEIGGVSDEDWFEESDSGRRFRLLMKHDEYQELMFVDQAGFKTGTVSFEDFAWQLTNGSVAPLGLPARPAELVAERLNMMAQRFRERRREAQQARERPAPEAQKPVAQEEKEEIVSARQRRAEADERREQALREAPAASADTAADDPRRRKWARLLVSGLTLGSWLTLERDGETLQRKLILILSSTDKYVLVGADGTGRLEYARAELIQGVLDGSITVVGGDSRYDDTLGRVVDGLQRKNAAG